MCVLGMDIILSENDFGLNDEYFVIVDNQNIVWMLNIYKVFWKKY